MFKRLIQTLQGLCIKIAISRVPIYKQKCSIILKISAGYDAIKASLFSFDIRDSDRNENRLFQS